MSNPLSLKLQNKRLILASGSPRRKELLEALAIPFVIETREVNEVYPMHLQGAEITDYLSELKAGAFQTLPQDTIIITSDTIVWLDGKALTKPKDRGEAIAILQELSGKKHEVFTSVCIKSSSKTRVFSDVTKVYFKELNSEEIQFYVDHYRPYDKAGAYGAQDWIGYIGIEKLEGSYFNVMGLPVHKLYTELMKW